MILAWLFLIPFIGGIAAWIAEQYSRAATRWVALAAMAAQLVIAVVLWVQYWGSVVAAPAGDIFLLEFNAPWIPFAGIGFHLALDGISLLFIVLTGLIGVIAVAASWTDVKKRVGFFHFNLLWTFAGITGVFLAVDLFLFYLFWELMLIPLYFLIDQWGHERRHYAAVKFFIFTQLGGLFLLLGILGLFFAHLATTGTPTFSSLALLGTRIDPALAFWLMLGFFIAFAVKLPAVPVHTWLPDAHTQAPVAGSVVLAGLVLKVGAYGLLRLVVPLFPAVSFAFAPIAMILGVAGIIYGAVLAFGQRDLKRLIAYTSVSHMGFVLLGIYAWNELALQGALIVMLAHGLSTGALFVLVGIIDERIHSRNLDNMGGFDTRWPRMGGFGLVLAAASLGLPGLANFIGEFLVLLGTFQVSPVIASIGAVGLVVSVIYSVWIVYRVFWGPPPEQEKGTELNRRETAMLAAAVALLLWIGLYPQTFISTMAPAVRGLLGLTGTRPAPAVYRDNTTGPAAGIGGEHGHP
ncbi:MAG: complex I subunit 4 family protein [Armatimonadota bacterium]